MSRTMPPVEGSEAEDWMPVRISREVAAGLFVRDKDGRRLTWDFGQPDADGFYTPTITTSEDDWFEARQQADGIDTERLARALMDMTQGWAESVEAMVDPGDYADGIPSVREFAAAIAEKYRLRGPQVRGGG